MNIINLYESLQQEIEQKHETFQEIWNLGDSEILPEFIFCLCTPQSNAKSGWKAVQRLSEFNLIYDPNIQQKTAQVEEILSISGVRFKKNKAKYIVQAIQIFNKQSCKDFVNHVISKSNNMIDARNNLAKNVNGYGMKEASHFLRNIGHGDDICILDRHILRNLEVFKVIESIPKHLDAKTYLDIEQKMLSFSKDIDIPVFALDFVFWYNAKGELFK